MDNKLGFEYERKEESTKITIQKDYRIQFVFQKNNSQENEGEMDRGRKDEFLICVIIQSSVASEKKKKELYQKD